MNDVVDTFTTKVCQFFIFPAALIIKLNWDFHTVLVTAL